MHTQNGYVVKRIVTLNDYKEILILQSGEGECTGTSADPAAGQLIDGPAGRFQRGTSEDLVPRISNRYVIFYIASAEIDL